MADKWTTEFQRLQRHRAILQGKLCIPCNEATQATLRAHLARIGDGLALHVGAAFREADKERFADPIERELALKAQRKRFGKYWSPERRQEYKERLRELRLEADEGITLPKWKPLSDEEFAACKERIKVILAKYARVPA